MSNQEKIFSIDRFENDINFHNKIEYIETIPTEEAKYKDVDNLNTKNYLDKNNIHLYQHQTLAIEKVLLWHHQWKNLYSNLKFIIDEAHYYNGIFGSNIAFLIRRLKRIADFYGSDPKFILFFASLADSLELAEKITGEKFDIISDEYSTALELGIYLRFSKFYDFYRQEGDFF